MVTEAFDIVERILLGSPVFRKISLMNEGVRDMVEILEMRLIAIRGELEDAEQHSSTPSVQNWLHRLKDVAYDIEDTLDLISTQDLEDRVNGSSFLREIVKTLPDYRLARKVNIICLRLEKVAEDIRGPYRFKQHSRMRAFSDECSERVTHSSVLESVVFGREHDKECVLDCLFKWSGDDVKHPRVLPIIAIGGMGKTTLLQLVMNDDRVAKMFDVRIWAYISKEFVLKTTLTSILQSATGENYSGLEMGALQRKLHEVLEYKKYLIVLDDVWIEDSKQWLQLKDLLAVGGRGSTILVTTRDQRVASLTGTMKPYKLKELSDMDSWTIFLKYAFSEGEEKAHPLLARIGKSIITKCRGVPLAAKTLGSLLRHKRDYRDWKRVEESELWEIAQGPNDILPILKLSFDHAPYLLRLCFASCAMFGKGYALYRSDLISLWMAHGFLQCGDASTEDALDLGNRCFDELISRSFFELPGYSITKAHAMSQEEDFKLTDGQIKCSQMSYEDAISQGFRTCDGKVICVQMNDLLHDLASYVVREETAVVGRKTDNISVRTRHLVWDRKQLVAEDFPMDLLRANKARTFAFLYPMEYISKSFLDTLISNFRCLRILVFIHGTLKKLPESIGNLKHLRYLDLRGNYQLELLPRSVCNLINLNVLDLGKCEHLEMLPRNVHRLISLKTLTLTFRFTRLQERALRGWNSLQVLKLTFCPNLVSLSEEFGSLKSLRVLIIRECDSLADLPNSICSLTNLEHITLESCRELDLERWEGLRDLVRLRFFFIDNLPRLMWIPDMGKAAETLQYLKISNCMSFSSFPENLQDCTSLLKLHVFSCPSLTSLPSGFLSLMTLQELRILGCPELSWKCEREIGEYWHLIAHIPEVYIDESVIQNPDVPTKQVEAADTGHDHATESCFNSSVGDSIEAFIETTANFIMSRGDSLSNKAERQSPISPDEYTQLTPPTPTEIVPVWKDYQSTPNAVPIAELLLPTFGAGFEDQGTDDNNNYINKEEAKRLLFLFDEGYEFEKQMLIELWMALGLLADEPMEENGAYYFENLVTEEYILCSVANSLYRVNWEKLGTELNIENHSYIKLNSTRQNSDPSIETLHASIVCDEINASVFQTLRGFSRLRTLLFLGSYGSRLQQVPRDLFLCYESLEALDLSGTHIKELPSSAGKMINLRFLDLSWTFLEALPERIDRFKKLQTLKLEGCSRLRKLPNKTKELTDLRHLHLDVLELSAFPKGVGALVNIRTLSAFPVGTEQGLEISELKYLDHITGSFCIAKIENVQSADGAKKAFLNNKKNIKKLKLRWSNHKIEHRMNEAECILQNLCPSSDVEEIQIVCYPGVKLPDWIADVSYDKLVSITLFGCVKVNMLPSMGKLPSLSSLELISLNSVTEINFKGAAADYVSFPKLQKLSVDGMLNLRTWAEAGEGDYPCLLELSIKDCPELLQFPSVVYFPNLKHLEVSGCKNLALVSDERLSMSLEQLIVEDCPLMEDRCCNDVGQDWHKIQHVPTIWVNQVAIQSIENTGCFALEMVDSRMRSDKGSFTINNNNVFSALESLRKKKSVKEKKSKGSPEAPAMEDVDDEDDDDYYATTLGYCPTLQESESEDDMLDLGR